jgi:hypothetical protein
MQEQSNAVSTEQQIGDPDRTDDKTVFIIKKE